MAEEQTGRIVLLSIHPRHADSILRGTKQVELRRSPLSPESAVVLLYATAPVRAVVGWFEVSGIDSGTKTRIWEEYGRTADITRREFRKYFDGATRAFAIRVGKSSALKEGVGLDQIPSVIRPPQSFQYLEPSSVGWIFERPTRASFLAA